MISLGRVFVFFPWLLHVSLSKFSQKKTPKKNFLAGHVRPVLILAPNFRGQQSSCPFRQPRSIFRKLGLHLRKLWAALKWVPQDPKPYKVKRNAIYYDRTQHGTFRGELPFQAAKQHLNNS